jgi:hypothetical protein
LLRLIHFAIIALIYKCLINEYFDNVFKDYLHTLFGIYFVYIFSIAIFIDMLYIFDFGNITFSNIKKLIYTFNSDKGKIIFKSFFSNYEDKMNIGEDDLSLNKNDSFSKTNRKGMSVFMTGSKDESSKFGDEIGIVSRNGVDEVSSFGEGGENNNTSLETNRDSTDSPVTDKSDSPVTVIPASPETVIHDPSRNVSPVTETNPFRRDREVNDSPRSPEDIALF